jgi:Domain of unknown function (DUF4260)
MVLATVVTWQLWFFLIAPDLPLLAGLGGKLEPGRLNPRAVPFYNATHRLWEPFLLAVVALLLPSPIRVGWLVGAAAWLLHIAVDRLLGFGLRDAQGYQRQG